MRLITRSDFDGLACGALLLEAKVVDSWMFAHPKDIQDGLVPVTENDVLANVPFAPGCGLWFDHHSSEEERLKIKGHYKGESRISPSAARIIYEYYGGKERFPNFDDLMLAVDKVDSGQLTAEEILNPTGWILRSRTFQKLQDKQLSAYGKTACLLCDNVYRRNSQYARYTGKNQAV